MRWRSPQEIAFRLKQEARNLALFARPPLLPEGAEAAAPFPDPSGAVEALRGSRTAEAIAGWASAILGHRFPLLGVEIDTGPEIRWRRDYGSGKETAPIYFRRIPYLDTARAGDHKIIWELNRHQHLALLAQAHLITGERKYLNEIGSQLDSWFEANPFQRGINWASALEVAFRALSWMWVDHLAGSSLEAAQRRRLIEGLYRHGLHLETNLSVYFSPNTHLLGEAVALHALGRMFRGTPRAELWEKTGARIVAEQIERQVRGDGSHFEQSTSYHVYALDMFLFHAILVQPSEAYRSALGRMAEYLHALMGPARALPSLGDDDGGRFFHPFGERERFGRATLAACGCFLGRPEWIGEEEDLHDYAVWWLGPRSREQACGTHAGGMHAGGSKWFPDAGTAVMRAGGVECIVDAGPLGTFSAGHSHADALSVVARVGGRDLLIDPGTFTYDGRSPWRNTFRGTAAHNTVRLARLDQADPAGPFGWRNPPQVVLRQWCTGEGEDFVDAECRYRGFLHRRRVLFLKPELLFILDSIECGDGDSRAQSYGQIEAEQFWHPGSPVQMLTPDCFRIGDAGMLVLALAGATVEWSEGGEFGWRSRVYGLREAAPLVMTRQRGVRAMQLGSVVAFSAPERPGALEMVPASEGVRMTLSGAWQASVTFPKSGMPRREA
jgi:hypothetical protein